MKEKIGWGFIGAGSITNRFMNGIQNTKDAYLAAVASRTYEKAKDLAEKNGAKAYETIDEMLQDPNVDVVYVATPHTLHAKHTIMALKTKPVLCEKPLAPNAEQGKKMVRAARDHDTYLLEAMWTRFFPAMHKVREWIKEGKIGELHHVRADFGFRATYDATSRLFDPNLAGGSLLDVGVYTVSFASMVMGGPPARIESMAQLAPSGVDERMACLFHYDNGGLATLVSAIRTNTRQEACITGEKGLIVIPKFWSPRQAVLYQNGKLCEEFMDNSNTEGFEYEVAAVHEDLRQGRKENVHMPLDESIKIAQTMDEIRKCWGLRYPFEV